MKKLLAFLLFFIFAALYLIGYRINTSSSIPPGIYKLEKSDNFNNGDLVVFCLTADEAEYAKMKGYISLGIVCPSLSVPLTKYIAASAGDSVSILDNIKVNGEILINSHVLKTDRYGEPTKTVKYPQRLLKDKQFLMYSGYNPNSYDSRYYGLIEKHQIIGKSKPVFIW